MTANLTGDQAGANGEPVRTSAAALPGRNRIFFIVGAGRSGTTLLRLILAGHSRLHVCPETWFIEDLVVQLPTQGRLTGAQIEHAIQLMTRHHRWQDLAITESALRAALPDTGAASLRQVIDAVYGCLARQAGKPRLGDKTPVYARILPSLSALYPDAQFIHLLRDGRDVAISYIDAGWHYRCYQGDRFEWNEAVDSARRFATGTGAGTWLELRYEDLVRAPEETVRRICSYLGEDFEPAMMDAAQRTSLIPARERHIHQRAEQPINADSVAGWRRRLSLLELFVMEACLHRNLRRCGYDLYFAGRRWRVALDIAGSLLKGAAPVLLLVLPALKRRGFINTRSCL